MLFKDLNLYINEKNIVTLKPFASNTAYGITINGIDYKFGEMLKPDKDLQRAKLAKMKSIVTNLIKRIEK